MQPIRRRPIGPIKVTNGKQDETNTYIDNIIDYVDDNVNVKVHSKYFLEMQIV